ncbi:MAG TPA: hypothetical protein PLD23_07910 [Armatimonadota bacterium]|nr:hypothetical protein [Armatimonadota bacterium]HQK93416.1 hypothetical protein [Armatimonadota bacterium]
MRPPAEEGWVTVTFRLRPALRQALQDESYATNTTQQEIVEEALRRELDRRAAARAPVAAE